MLRLVLATAFATTAVLVNDHGGLLGDVGVVVLVFASMWLIVEEAIARVQLAIHRAFTNSTTGSDNNHDGDRST